LRLNQSEAPKNIQTGQDPRLIVIPKASIEVNVIQGGIVGREWILSDKNALYLPSSGRIGEGYNTIIYAHNREGLFKDLKKLKKEDLILVKDNKENIATYKIYSVENIDPKDIDKLYSKEKDILTLFTCDGWFDRERLLVRARLMNITTPSTRQE
jgi:LPXTG-site transpeptidase (sortase) family protein